MSAQTLFLLILVGFAAGVLSGMVGVGGGIIIVPCLVMLLGFTQKQAQGTSLAILLLPIGILAVLQYYKAGHIKINVALTVAFAFIIGGYLGSKLALSIDEQRLKRIFAVTMMLIAIKMLFFDKQKPRNAPESAKVTTSISEIGPVNPID